MSLRTYSFLRITLLPFLILVLLLSLFQPQTTASAAAVLTITPLTWNIIGLDSNNVNVGPNNFPVGARVVATYRLTLTPGLPARSDLIFRISDLSFAIVHFENSLHNKSRGASADQEMPRRRVSYHPTPRRLLKVALLSLDRRGCPSLGRRGKEGRL